MLEKKGFTLPEVVITIAIVGILSMVAVPVYKGYVNKSISNEGKALLAEINAAEHVYYARNGSFYATTDETNDRLRLGVDASKNKYFTSYTVTTSEAKNTFTAITRYNNDNDKSLTLVGSLSAEPEITDNFSGK